MKNREDVEQLQLHFVYKDRTGTALALSPLATEIVMSILGIQFDEESDKILMYDDKALRQFIDENM